MAGNVYKLLKDRYKNKKVLIVGLGVLGGGVGLAKFFAGLGAKVTITDNKNKTQLASALSQLKHLPIEYHLEGHPKEIFLKADVIVKGPFVSWHLPPIVAAEKKGIPIEMELSFFAQYSPAKIIGITGSRGKSTTTMMIYKLLKQAGWPVHLGGSLPHISTINYLKTLTFEDWVVMELPSWPLSGFHRKKISPRIAVFTNFYPDHLNYYKRVDDYLSDKKAIYLYQRSDDFLIANKSLQSITSQDKPKSKIIYFQPQDFPVQLKFLKGKHNLENAAAALTLAKALNLNLENCIKSIQQFSGLPFRQQVVDKKGDVIFVNDTTSTTPVATIKAIEAFADKNIILILGGNSKNLPFNTLIKHLIKVKKIVLLAGSFTEEILPILKQKYSKKITEVYSDLEKAVNKSYQLAQELKEEVYVLFSPAATSFAMFNNEFHRGEEFNKIISQLL